MNKKIIALIILFLGVKVYSQEKNNFFQIDDQLVGVQFNPFIPIENLNYAGDFWVYALRYGMQNNVGLSIGPEVCGSFGKINGRLVQNINLGLFARYAYSLNPKISLFAECSGYYAWYNYGYSEGEEANGIGTHGWLADGIQGYIAPGVTLPFFWDRFSMDLMVKFASDIIVINYKIAPSFKVNYSF